MWKKFQKYNFMNMWEKCNGFATTWIIFSRINSKWVKQTKKNMQNSIFKSETGKRNILNIWIDSLFEPMFWHIKND